MRLLIAMPTFPPVLGGIQTYGYELARRLHPRCDALTVVAPGSQGARAFDRTLPFRVHRVPAIGDDLALTGALPIATLARLGRFETVFAGHWASAHGALRAGHSGWPKRVFCAAHGKELLHHPLRKLPLIRGGYERIRDHALARSSGFFPVSEYTAGLLVERGVPPSRITTVPNGVDPEAIRFGDREGIRRRLGLEDRKLLLTVARLVRRKGIDTVLEALPKIISEVPDAFYLIVGSGPDRERIAELIQRRGLEDSVRMLGSVPGPLADYYSAADVFVMPARTEPEDAEGFGLVFLEAGACERAVVGARAGGVPDAIVHGETGLLVEPNDPAGLASALVELLNDPVRAAAMGKRARERILAEGTWDHAAERIFEALSQG
ncbi:MAG: glycosyltransferase family 4 protein [Myxococcota bacterium]